MRSLISCMCLLMTLLVHSQELHCKVTIDTQQVSNAHKQVFAQLEQKLQELLNNTNWTTRKVQAHERINCQLTLVVSHHQDENFVTNLQIQASRPIYGSNYQSTIINHRESLNFTFLENTPLVYNEEEFSSNLISVMAYYAYLIVGIDANTFSPMGGKPYFEKALKTALLAQSSNDNAWKDNGQNNRWKLINELMLSKYEPWHQALYYYHRLGLDLMYSNISQGKKGIVQAITALHNIPTSGLSSFPIQVFFNAKAMEISDVFSSGNTPNAKNLKENLIQLAPTQASLWQKIK